MCKTAPARPYSCTTCAHLPYILEHGRGVGYVLQGVRRGDRRTVVRLGLVVRQPHERDLQIGGTHLSSPDNRGVTPCTSQQLARWTGHAARGETTCTLVWAWLPVAYPQRSDAGVC